jgi:MEMO1 family protein
VTGIFNKLLEERTMIRPPAVAGQFYPANPKELSRLVLQFTQENTGQEKIPARACLVPHAGYLYSGHVAGRVFSRVTLPKKIVILGVRHYPRGQALAIVSKGAWRTPLGDVPIDEELALRLCAAAPLLREDEVAHRSEHSLEVELPFLQVLDPEFTFVPVALGAIRFEELAEVGEGLARVLAESREAILLLTSSDMNHYESDARTRFKDHQAIEAMLRADARELYEVCRREAISMCGLGPAVVMLTALEKLGVKKGELVEYATSGDITGDRASVVGYAGMIFQ